LTQVRVPFARLPGWLDRFETRHPGCSWSNAGSEVVGTCPDGSTATVSVPFGAVSADDQSGRDARAALVEYSERQWRIGLLIVRRGGFAVALTSGTRVLESKVGRRHVQGRTKAGGWSQQRFARRRDNQARQAFDAATDHAARVLGTTDLDALAVGGDRLALSRVLADDRLTRLRGLPRVRLGAVGDPKPGIAERWIEQACSVSIVVADAE
jgi:hypothetical protein